MRLFPSQRIFYGTLWDIFQAPAAMIPDPIDLRVHTQECHSQLEVCTEDIVDVIRLARSPEQSAL